VENPPKADRVVNPTELERRRHGLEIIRALSAFPARVIMFSRYHSRRLLERIES
jgi:hypothetical protein